MPTIKRKVEMNLPQLIEWGFENDITGSFYANDFVKAKRVRFGSDTFVAIHGELNKFDTFTVEVEEEIAKCTKVPKLLTIFKYNKSTYSEIHENKSINEILQLDRKLENSVTRSIHMFENDETFTLLWKNGKLVE